MLLRAYCAAVAAPAPTKRIVAWAGFIFWGEVVLRTIGWS